MRVFFGGSFDPVHRGHVEVANSLRDLGARVILLISVNPPFRSAAKASTEHRMAMLRLALDINDVNNVNNTDQDIRIERGDSVCDSPFTVDVLRKVRACLGDKAPLAWALGSDQFAHLNTWRDWHRLAEFAHLIVFPRRGQRANTQMEVRQGMDARRATIDRLFKQPAGCVAHMENIPPQVSSTEIRQRLQCGKSVSGSLPNSVIEYIHAQGLYGVA